MNLKFRGYRVEKISDSFRKLRALDIFTFICRKHVLNTGIVLHLTVNLNHFD